jgi:hypothetical protein
LYRKPVVDGVSRVDEGAVLDDFCPRLRQLGVRDLMDGVQGKALQRAMVPGVQDLVRDGVNTRFGIERRHALPAWLCRDEALLPWVGCNAPQGRPGVGPRGAATRQPPRTAGPLCPETLADHSVPRQLRHLAAWFNGTRRALAPAGLFGATVTGLVEATALATTAADEGWGHVPRTRQMTDKHGHGRASEVTV